MPLFYSTWTNFVNVPSAVPPRCVVKAELRSGHAPLFNIRFTHLRYSPLHSHSQLHFSYLSNRLHLHHSRSPDYTITFPVSHTLYTSHFPHVTVGPRLTTDLKLKTTAPQLVSLPFCNSQVAMILRFLSRSSIVRPVNSTSPKDSFPWLPGRFANVFVCSVLFRAPVPQILPCSAQVSQGFLLVSPSYKIIFCALSY